MKISNDTIGNQTRDLPTCSAVPQPTARTSSVPQLYLCASAYTAIFDNFAQVETCSKELNNEQSFVTNCSIFLSNIVPQFVISVEIL